MNVIIYPNNVHTYERCRLCDCGWDAADAIADILDDRGRCIGHVCPSCLAAGPQGTRRRMVSHAERLEGEAADLRAMAAEDEWEAFPALADWQAMAAEYGSETDHNQEAQL